MKTMNKEILLMITMLLLLMAIPTSNAELITNVGDEESSVYHVNNRNSSVESKGFEKIGFIDFSKDIKKQDIIITGRVSNCNDSKPFEGSKIFMKSLKGKKLATTFSDSKGKYNATFKSSMTKFIVEARYPGHVYPSEKVTVSGSENIKYGKANFKLGELIANKGSTYEIIFNQDGNLPNSHLIHL